MKQIQMNDFQRQVWEANYKAPEDTCVEDTWRRVASTLATAEQNNTHWFNNFYDLLYDFKFMPGGRITANAGIKDRDGASMFNCFVYSPQDFGIKDIDSIQIIFETLKKSAKVLASEGGIGINLSWIRPNGSYIKGTGVRTPGVVKFMQLWDKTSQIITLGSNKQLDDKYKSIQKKKIRKGAMLSVLSISSPDIKQFITAKQKSNSLSKFNLSVLIPDKFIHAVQNDLDWQLKFPDTDFEKYKDQWDGNFQLWEQKGYPFIVYETIKARELWDLIMISTYTRNEPGVLFLDTVNNLNPLKYCEYISCANPCGQTNMPSNICCIGNINLVKFFNSQTMQFNYGEFKKYIALSVRLLDNVLDISSIPIDEYRVQIQNKRRIGIGVLGVGSLLYMMRIRFGSETAIQLIDAIFKAKAQTELLTSAKLGVIKGSFKSFDRQKYFNTEYWKSLQISPEIKKQIQNIGQMRNGVSSTCPPVGNGSIFAGLVSGGIEPVFMKEYTRWTIVNYDQKQKIFKRHRQIVYQWLGYNMISDSRQLQQSKHENIPDPHRGEWYQTLVFKFVKKGSDEVLKGTIDGIDYQIDKNRGLIKAVSIQDYGWKYVKEHYQDAYQNNYIVQSQQLSVQEHINMLAASAKYVNQNQSKTINIPANYSFEDFKSVYYDAWKRNIKGITTYRAGTMQAVLQQKKKVQQYQSELQQLFIQSNGNVITQDVKIPTQWQARGYTLKDKHGKKWYVSVAFADRAHKKPFALFIRTNNKQTTQVADTVITAMETLCRTKGISEQIIQKQRQKYSGQSNVDKIGRAIGLALRHNVPIIDIVYTLEEYNDGLSTLLFHIRKLLSKFIKDGTVIKNAICPNCGSSNLVFESGCSSCLDCAASKCS